MVLFIICHVKRPNRKAMSKVIGTITKWIVDYIADVRLIESQSPMSPTDSKLELFGPINMKTQAREQKNCCEWDSFCAD